MIKITHTCFLEIAMKHVLSKDFIYETFRCGKYLLMFFIKYKSYSVYYSRFIYQYGLFHKSGSK